MTDLIERMARAIRAQQVGQLGDDSVPAWEEIDEGTREDYRDDARAALAEVAAALEVEAMRPPRTGLPTNKGWYEAAEFLRAAAKRDGRTE